MNKIAIEFWIENDILNVVFHNESVTFEEVDYAIKKRLELAAGKSFLFFSDARKIKRFSREARARMAQKDASEGVIAVAILIKSKTHMMMYNFFASIYKPAAPSKVFTNKDKALIWLSAQKKA